jgi:hypothetical protein
MSWRNVGGLYLRLSALIFFPNIIPLPYFPQQIFIDLFAHFFKFFTLIALHTPGFCVFKYTVR